MAKEKLAMTAVAGVGIIGATVCSTWGEHRSIDNTHWKRSAGVNQFSERHRAAMADSKEEPLSHRFTNSVLRTGGNASLGRREQEGLHETRDISKKGEENASEQGPAHTFV